MSDNTLTVEQLNAAQAELDRQKAVLMATKIDEALETLVSADIENLAAVVGDLANNMVNGNSRQQLNNLVSMLRTLPNILAHERSTFQAILNPPLVPNPPVPIP